MAASTILWKGHTTRRPGVYSQTFAETTAGTGALARGTVALLGYIRNLEHGVVHRFNSMGAVRRAMGACGLRDACELAFYPTTDPKIPGVGAKSLIVVGVNPNTQATKQFPVGATAAGLKLLSCIWGATGNAIGIKLAAAGAHPVGRKVTATFDGTSYVLDDLGGEACMVLRYTGGEASTAVVDVVRGSAGCVDVRFTKTTSNVLYSPDAAKMAFDGYLTLTLSQVQGAPKTIHIIGKWQGATITEDIAVGAADVGPFTTANRYDVVTSIDCSTLIALTTTTIAGSAAKALFASYSTVQNVVDYLTSKLVGHGYTVTSTRTDRSSYVAMKMDTVTASNIVPATVSLWAVLDDMVTAINAAWSEEVDGRRQGFIEAEEYGTTGGVPSTTGADPIYLEGGLDNDGSTVTQDWTDALVLLRNEAVTAGWVQSDSATIHEEVRKHVVYCNDRNEQFWFIGATALESLATLKSRVPLLNTPFLSLWFQGVRVTVGGSTQSLTPPYVAAMIAGMFAGRPVAWPLLWKSVRILGTTQASAIDPDEDADDILAGGLNVINYDPDKRQYHVERDITTYVASDEPELAALSAAESWATSKKDLRAYAKAYIGDPNFGGTAAQLRAALAARLRRQATRGDLAYIKAWRSLTVEDLGDRFDVDYEMAAVEPVTFITITQHVTREAAA